MYGGHLGCEVACSQLIGSFRFDGGFKMFRFKSDFAVLDKSDEIEEDQTWLKLIRRDLFQ